ncbi:hypothetical protein ES703_125099 [subsurface metagenome]
MTNMCPECGFESGSAYGLKIHQKTCDQIEGMKGELRKIWRSGIPTTWSNRKIKRWIELTNKLKEMGVDTTKQHFFLESRTQARTLSKGAG